MKFQYYISLLVLIISCGQASKTENAQKRDTQDAIEGAVEIIETTTDSLPIIQNHDFEKTITNTKTLNLPHIEAANFDSFIDEDDYNEVDVNVMKLEQIYPDFNSERHNFRAIAMHSIPLSDSFHSVVVTVLKSEHEMETVLINYDNKGTIIAHEIVSYDEIAEGMSRTLSRISESRLTVNRIFWSETKEIEEIDFEIRYDGTIEKLDSKSLNDAFKNFSLIDGVLTDLKLDWVQTKTKFIITKEDPVNPYETLVVIPEIVNEGKQYFDLNSHIVVADNRTGKINQNYFESSQTNQWVSDAIELDGIKIDASAYKISENKVAFGVYASYFGQSKVNPYQNKSLSLFIKSGDSLIKVLSEYTVENYIGERNGNCNGESIGARKTLMVGTEKTKSYLDLIVNNKVIESRDFEDNQGKCQSNKIVQLKNTVLKFNGKKYVETDTKANIFSEFHPTKLENINIEKFDMDHGWQLEDFKFVTGNYQPKNGKQFDSDTEAESDWGDRLLMLDASDQIVFQSHGVGEVYLFEPHFYKSDLSDKFIIICQKAFEYPFGGEVFIFENGQIKYIGPLDFEGNDEEKYLTDIVQINELENTLVFALKSDAVVLKPGSKDIKTKKNVVYIYQDNELILKTSSDEF